MAEHSVAVIFDFDDTLVPDSTTALLASKGVDTEEFWQRARSLVENGWDQVHAYLSLLLRLTAPGGPLEGLTNEQLSEFGGTLKPYRGVGTLFRDIKQEVEGRFAKHGIGVDFWVISGGLEEVVRGCTKISSHLKGFWGCRLEPDEPGGPVKHIKRTVSFTEKTRYLFEIHKGLTPEQTNKNPFLVNKNIAEDHRPVPFRNMIYVGDGLTDVPCFSLIETLSNKAGVTYGVIGRDEQGRPRREILQALVDERRVTRAHFPAYGKNSELGAFLRTDVLRLCSAIYGRESQAFGY